MAGISTQPQDVVRQGTDAAQQLEIHAGRLKGSTLLQDYYAGVPALAPFFGGYPFDPAAYRRKLAEVTARLQPDQRARLGPAIRATSPAAQAKLERIIDGEGVLVTTGQQAGLFGGPLYTVYKILSAVRLAATLERLLERPVAPLFWVAADDHDWAEISHTQLLDDHNQLRRVALIEGEDETPSSMAHRQLGASVSAARAELAALLPESEFAADLRAVLERTYTAETTVAGAFEELLAELFAPMDLLLVNAGHPLLKEAAAPLLRREIRNVREHGSLVERQTQKLVAAGYHEQVTIQPGACNVFLEDEQGRERLVRTDRGWRLRRTKRELADDEILALLDADPMQFSPNVLLRPVVESALFPTVAYVGGPAETSYFAQIGCLFQAHGIQAPVVFPRFSVTLVEPKIRKVLDKFSMTVASFQRPFHEVATALVRSEMPDAVTTALHAIRQGLQDGYAQLQEVAAGVDPTLSGPLRRARNTSLAQVSEAEKKIAKHLKDRNEVAVEQLRKASTNLFPDGSPQERVFSPLMYLARYGRGLLLDLLESLWLELDSTASGWTGVQCET